MKKISIIIPAHNEEKTLAKIIDQVKKLDLSPIEKEIIVVDNNSTDNTFHIASYISGKFIIVRKIGLKKFKR